MASDRRGRGASACSRPPQELANSWALGGQDGVKEGSSPGDPLGSPWPSRAGGRCKAFRGRGPRSGDPAAAPGRRVNCPDGRRTEGRSPCGGPYPGHEGSLGVRWSNPNERLRRPGGVSETEDTFTAETDLREVLATVGFLSEGTARDPPGHRQGQRQPRWHPELTWGRHPCPCPPRNGATRARRTCARPPGLEQRNCRSQLK